MGTNSNKLVFWLASVGIIVALASVSRVQGGRGKLLANFPFVELADFRFGLGDPYLIFYERENYKGKVHYHRIGKGCSNLGPDFSNWASSVDLQRRCVKLCTSKDCGGRCVMALPDTAPKSARGIAKLDKYSINDAVMSVKYCYGL